MRKLVLKYLALGLMLSASARAATNFLDFNVDPSTNFYKGFSAADDGVPVVLWRASGGATTGGATDGYLGITDSHNGQRSALVVHDLEKGLIVKSFSFECDVRIGGGTHSAADGFSVNYCSTNDPVVIAADAGTNPSGMFAGTDGEPAPSALAEEGTQTGLAIGFDQWQSGALNGGTYWDVPGISVRVDGQLLAQFPMPLRTNNVYRPTDPLPTAGNLPYVDDTPCCGNGAAGPEMDVATNDVLYINSLQTGARNTNEYLFDGLGNSVADTQQPAYGDPADIGSTNYNLWMQNLKWEHFKAELTDDSHVKITFKGQELTPPGGLPTTFAPRPGRIVFAGRTGGSRSVMQIDNLRLVTLPFTSVAPLGFSGNAAGFTLQLQDQGTATLETTSVGLTNNGVALTSGITLTKIGTVTYVHYAASPLLAVGSTNIVGFGYKDNFGIQSTGIRQFVVGSYTTIPAEYANASVVTTGSGFSATVKQLPIARGPGDGNTIANAERHLADGFIDPSNGQPYANIVQAGPGPGGTYPLNVINWNEYPASVNDGVGADIGFFQGTNAPPADVADDPIPGIPGGPDRADLNDNVVVQALAYLDLPAGYYTFGVNSDDGFKVSTSRGGANVLGLTLDSFNGGRGQGSPTLFDVYVPTGGIFPVRLLWWEGGGGANCEFFYVDQMTGVKRLINDRRDSANQIKAYTVATTTKPYVSRVKPEPNQLFVFADSDVSVDITDGTETVGSGSAQLFLNGTQVGTAAKNGSVTTITKTGSLSSLLPAGGNNLSVVYSFTDGGNTVTVTNTSTFSVVPYAVIPAANAVPAGQVDQGTTGFKVTVMQIDRSGDGDQGRGGRITPGDQNRMPFPAVELANGNINPTNGLPYPNLADLSATNEPGIFDVGDVINWNLNNTASNAVVGNSGIFNGGNNLQAANNPADTALPGLPGAGTSNAGLDNSVHEIRTYLNLKAGVYVMAVNSDDGFVAISAHDPHDTLGTLLGYCNQGRGNSNPLPTPGDPATFVPTPGANQNNSAFGVVVPQDGIYPFRVLYWEGGGGVNVEFLSVDKGSGQQALINDTAVPWAIKAYQNYTGPARPWVKFSVSPTPWDNRVQQSGPGKIVTVGRTRNSNSSSDILNSSDSTRPWANSVGAVVAHGVGDPTLALWINGAPVAATFTTNGSDVTVRYPTPLPSGSTNTASLVYGGTTNSWRFIVQTYTNLNASDAQPLSAAAGGTRGFRVRMTQVASIPAGYVQNSVARAEAQLAGILGPDISMPGPGPNGTYTYNNIINWNNNVNVNRSGAQIGNFQANNYGAGTGWPYAFHPDEPVPGVPNTRTNAANANTDNIAAEVFAYLEFDTPGYYRFGVNSDDGYAVKVGTTGVTNGTVITSVDVGKGSSDIPFSFTVPQAGLYPIRLVFYNGGGGANLEYYSYDDSGNKIAINDTNNPAAIKAYYSISTAAQLQFTGATLSGVTLTINWTVPSGTTATLQQASVLTGSPTDWSPVPGVSGTSYSASAAIGQKFYRLVSP